MYKYHIPWDGPGAGSENWFAVQHRTAMAYGDWDAAAQIFTAWMKTDFSVPQSVMRLMTDCAIAAANVIAYCQQGQPRRARDELEIFVQQHMMRAYPEQLEMTIIMTEARKRLVDPQGFADLLQLLQPEPAQGKISVYKP